MKTLKRIFLFTFISAVFITCKKEQLAPTTVENQPVFSFTGSIAGNNNITWQAGVNNYYMYSTYTQDESTGVYSFNGKLQNTSTANNSIQVIINDYRKSQLNVSISSAHMDSALAPALAFGYNKGVPLRDTTGYNVKFSPHVYHGTASAYTYSFGDLSSNIVTTNSNPVVHTYARLGSYATSLVVDFISSCGNITVSNPYNLIHMNPLVIDSIHDSVNTRVSDSMNVPLSAAVSGGIPPYTYLWNFGDGSTSASPAPTHKYRDSSISENTYQCTLRVIDHVADTANYTYTVQDSGLTCRFDYSMSKPTPVVITDSNFLSDITIIYTNNSGTVYTSKSTLQPGSSTFRVTSVADYQTNIYGNPTKMLNVTFNCLLYNGANAIAASGTALIAVAYKP